MVQAIIHALPSSTHRQELVLLEFQGSFHAADDDDQTSSLQGLDIGQIDFQQVLFSSVLPKDKAILSTGHHRIEGVRKKLLKPLAVITKRSTSASLAMDLDDIQPTVEYNVTTLIKEKYVFSLRPRLVVKESLRGLTKIGG
ncbi:hypothetical protein DM01DRAFT_1381686 [Hesseltinella vesiculosa]|uniref:Uncharacterized protein n=1 Tax=Hesseltinella vesiculosa TaxID=101127 RepID=A0A1X2GNC5_9FUNG|nr:hypothetical protein DM01DRAFT_1381686 [Hesseltinella vesiculosa]